MKEIIKKIVFIILTIEARLVLLRYRPKIVAVSGTVGKTGTKDAIYCAMSAQSHVRKNNKSLNSEIGVPLTILGLESGWNNPMHWIKNIFVGALQIIWRPHYPKWLVLEIGIDHPGDMKKTASWLRPDVAVITAFGEIPVHVEFFDSPDAVSEEEGSIVNYVREGGYIILNADDEKVLKLKNKSKRKVYTFGQENEADVIATNQKIVYENDTPKGMSFKIEYEGNTLPVTLRGVVGNHLGYAILGAITTGIALELSLVKMTQALSELKTAPGRMRLIEGKNESIIIDDTYNSSPVAVREAINVLGEIDTKGSKIAILGDMLEIGRYSASEHRKVAGQLIEKGIDMVVTVGMRAEIIAKELIESGMSESKVFHFEKSEKAIKVLDMFLKPGNVILIKGSQGIRMEKIVKAGMVMPELAGELLVRQEGVWKAR